MSWAEDVAATVLLVAAVGLMWLLVWDWWESRKKS